MFIAEEEMTRWKEPRSSFRQPGFKLHFVLYLSSYGFWVSKLTISVSLNFIRMSVWILKVFGEWNMVYMQYLTHHRYSYALLFSYHCFFSPLAHTFLRKDTLDQILMKCFTVCRIEFVTLVDVVSKGCWLKKQKLLNRGFPSPRWSRKLVKFQS